MQGTAGAAAGSDGEVLLASQRALLEVGARNRVLEARRVGGVAGDGDVGILVPHDGNALADVVSTVAVDLGARTIGVGDGLHDLKLAREVVELGLDIGEAVDAGDDLGGVLAEAVQDNAQGLLAGLVGVVGDADGALSGGEGLVASEEGEALGVLAQQHGAQVAVAQADLAVLGNGAGHAEGLQADADGGSGIRRVGGVLLHSDGAAKGVGPLGVLKRDGLDVLGDLIGVETEIGADLQGFLEVGDAILSERLVDLVDAALVTFERNCHVYTPPFLLFARIDDLGGVVPLTIAAHGAVDGVLGVGASLDGVSELAEVQELEADDLVVLVQGKTGDVALGELEVTGALGGGAVGGAHHGAQTLAEVVEASADGQAVLGEGGLGAAVNDLQEELAHGDVDGVADEVGVQSLKNGLLREDLGGHGGGVGHARTADGLDKGLLDDALLDVEAQLAGTLLRGAPAHTVGVAGDVLKLLGLYPCTLFGDRRRTVVCTLGHGAHTLDVC